MEIFWMQNRNVEQSYIEILGATLRVARWFAFEPKIPIWEKFSGP
jgi:hypothetical protein